MDTAKCESLKRELATQSEPQCVPIVRFFDGNDDLGSIGCNLLDHPGVDAFREAFERVASRADVEGVWAQIFELDPSEDCWPFADTVVVAGTIPVEELTRLVASLGPDEVAEASGYQISPQLEALGSRLLVVWWD